MVSKSPALPVWFWPVPTNSVPLRGSITGELHTPTPLGSNSASPLGQVPTCFGSGTV